jgi:hypothetical protein
LVVLACVALIVAALAAIGVAVRLMRVARPVFMSADLAPRKSGGDPEDLDDREREAVRPVYVQAAHRFGFNSLAGLEQRERALRRAASRTTSADERTRRTALADEAKAEIEQALARGQVVVVRRRASQAISDLGAFALYFFVLAGLIAFALSADKVASDRSDTIAIAKACAEARKAGATPNELSSTKCDSSGAGGGGDDGTPSEATARADVVAKLADALSTCAALVNNPSDENSGPLQEAACQPVKQAITDMSK